MPNADSSELEPMSRAAEPSAPPRAGRRVLARALPWVVGLALGTAAVAAGVVAPRPPPRPDIHLALPAFSLTTERSTPFSRETLHGKVWIADFIFTTCPSVCPRLTERMRQLQDRTRDLGDALHLVSFTVDPENDTPDKLAAYARAHHADPARWTFVTGPLSTIEPTVVGGFKIQMGKRADPDSGLVSIFHGEKLVLVDQDGAIRGFFDADDPGLEAIEDAARALVKR